MTLQNFQALQSPFNAFQEPKPHKALKKKKKQALYLPLKTTP